MAVIYSNPSKNIRPFFGPIPKRWLHETPGTSTIAEQILERYARVWSIRCCTAGADRTIPGSICLYIQQMQSKCTMACCNGTLTGDDKSLLAYRSLYTYMNKYRKNTVCTAG